MLYRLSYPGFKQGLVQRTPEGHQTTAELKSASVAMHEAADAQAQTEKKLQLLIFVKQPTAGNMEKQAQTEKQLLIFVKQPTAGNMEKQLQSCS